MKNFIKTCIIFVVYFLMFTYNYYGFWGSVKASAICTVVTYFLVLKDYKFLDKLIEKKKEKENGNPKINDEK